MNDEHDDDNGVRFWHGASIALMLSTPLWLFVAYCVGRFFTEVKW
jgi:hypothetical protein